MINDLTPPASFLAYRRKKTITGKQSTLDLDLFDALHQLQIKENYRGHFLCEDRINGNYWERLVQGTHPLPDPISKARWRTSVDEWIEQHPTLPRFAVADHGDVSYRFWKEVLREVLVPQEKVSVLRSRDRQVWPAVTSPTPAQIRVYLVAISRRLEREERFVPSEQRVEEILEELNMIARDVPYYQDLATDKRVVYPGPYVRCQLSSAKLLGSIGRKYRTQQQKRKAGRVVAEYIVATAKELGITVPDARTAFSHLYPKSEVKKSR